MPLPSQLTYNDLSGDEIVHILEERFAARLNMVPYLQKHITLPRVRMTLNVKLEMYADQPTPEVQTINDTLEIVSNPSNPPEFNSEEQFEEVVDASPSTKGKPPDQVRDESGLPIPTPTKGQNSWEIGVHDTLTGRAVDSPGRGTITRSDQPIPGTRRGGTVVEQDLGPAGLREGRMDRMPMEQRGNRDGGPVEPPKKEWRR